jgi:uncharacterized protein (DUF1499 family)
MLTSLSWAGDAERTEGRLVHSCPQGTRNCVSSRDRDDSNYIRPLSFDGSAEVAWMDLKQALLEEPRTEIVDQGHFMLRAQSSSLVFGFVDDLSFELDTKEGVIEVQSASRVGFWDFGVNRRRIERIRERFTTLMARH